MYVFAFLIKNTNVLATITEVKYRDNNYLNYFLKFLLLLPKIH